MFFCQICSTTFSRKQGYELHLKSKKHLKRCDATAQHKCDCGKLFSCRQSLYLHKQNCSRQPVENNIVQHYESQLKQAEKEKQELKERIKQLEKENAEEKEKSKVNIETQNNINITIQAFGKENIDYITDKMSYAIVNKVYDSINTAASFVYFNTKHPENHNIRIPNKKEPYALILKEDRIWHMVDRKQAIENMRTYMYKVVSDSYERSYDELRDWQKRCFEKFRDQYDMSEETVIRRIERDLDTKVVCATRNV